MIEDSQICETTRKRLKGEISDEEWETFCTSLNQAAASEFKIIKRDPDNLPENLKKLESPSIQLRGADMAESTIFHWGSRQEMYVIKIFQVLLDNYIKKDVHLTDEVQERLIMCAINMAKFLDQRLKTR